MVENSITNSLLLKNTTEKALNDLSKGQGDCAVVSRLQGMIILKKEKIKNIIAVGPPIIQRKYCMAVTEGSANLLAKLNEGLSIIKTTGEYEEIYNKWFGIYEDTALRKEKILKYIIWIVSPLILIIILAFLWSWSLKNTVLKRTKALQESEQNLLSARNYISNIIDSMPSMLIGVDPDGKITQWNKTAQETTGIDVTDAQGENIFKILPQMTLLMENITQSIVTRKIILEHKKSCIFENSAGYEDVTIYPLIANGVEGAVIRIDDVSEKVRLEEMMIQSETMFSVGGLAAGMAHEINNPLAGVMQTADVISKRLTDMKMPANMRAAEEIGIHMEDINAFKGKKDMIKTMEMPGQLPGWLIFAAHPKIERKTFESTRRNCLWHPERLSDHRQSA